MWLVIYSSYMCGIVGVISKKPVISTLLDGLKRLEYRGYDSSGVLVFDETAHIYKVVASPTVLAQELLGNDEFSAGCVGIGHTRWATHGAPSTLNAHPHHSNDNRFWVVHNGVIENYRALRELLTEKGFEFVSQTDTEVVAHLVADLSASGLAGRELIQSLAGIIVGAYALVVFDTTDPDTLWTLRHGSQPIKVGIGDGIRIIASDEVALMGVVDQMIDIPDSTCARITLGEVDLFSFDLEHLPAVIVDLVDNLESVERGGFDHFMIKEIMTQPRVISDCTAGRIVSSTNEIVLSALKQHGSELLTKKRIVILGCGTSYYAGLLAKYMFEEFAHIPVVVEYASEFAYSKAPVGPDDWVIAISQSGTTADTLMALRRAVDAGAFTFGVCNRVGTEIPRTTHTGVYLHVGPEIGVASTKAFLGQATVLSMIAMEMGRLKGVVSDSDVVEYVKAIHSLPQDIQSVLDTSSETVIGIAERVHGYHHALFLGRGLEYPVALEGALKLKEVSYIHAEGLPAAEMKHGPIALIEPGMPVFVSAANTELRQKIVSNMEEVKARGGYITAITTDDAIEIIQTASEAIIVPKTHQILQPLLAIIPLQLLAYHTAVKRGYDPDRPRNLAKSVTVE